MTSDERAVAKVALELLQANPSISAAGVQFALGDDEKELTLDPGALVISAGFESEEEGSSLPKKYKLTVELRGLKRADPTEELDDIFARISGALCPPGQNRVSAPTASMALFQWISFEAQSGGDSSQSEINSRTRVYAVFALLRASDAPAPVNLTATEPGNTLIDPFQAFIDAITAFTDPSVALNVSGKNIKTISASLLNTWMTNQIALGFDSYGADFSHNQLDATTIAAILTAWTASASGGDPLDISSGANAEPTYQPEFYLFTVPAGASYSSDATLDIQYDGSDLDIIFKTDIALAASSVNTDTGGGSSDQWLFIGVSDHPTAAQIVAKIIALWATVIHKHAWTISAVAGASNQILVAKANVFTSISVQINTAAFTVVQHQVGNIASAIDDIINIGRAVRFNSGGAVVTLSPPT